MTGKPPPANEYDDSGETSSSSDWTRRSESTERMAPTGPIRPTVQAPPTGTYPPQRGHVRQRGRRPRARSPKDSGLYLPLWSLALMLIVVLAVSFGIVLIVASIGGDSAVNATPIFRIITSVPSPTPQFAQSVLATATLPPEAQQIIQQSPAAPVVLEGPTLEAVVLTATPEQVTIGRQIIVTGVGDTQLNVRDAPGITETTILFRAAEGEGFLVVDGPQQQNGFTWWRIQSPSDPSRSGWAAENYLQVITSR